MALNHSPSVVTNGLVLCYDEGNPKSGTTAELVSQRAATVASTTERRFAQDTLLSSIYASSAAYNSAANSPGTGMTLSTWFRRTGNTTGGWDLMAAMDGSAPRYRTFWFGFYTNQTSQIHLSLPYYTGSGTTTQFWDVNPTFASVGITLVTNQWYHFAGTYDNSSRVCNTYINARFAATGTRPGLGALNNPNNSTLQIFGCNNVSSFNAQTRLLTLYNRALSAAEVAQNFNALRGRFGL
jgi:hypothetical protein